MEKTENILYSLIPLIIIILISWLFSFLGSRKRTQDEGLATEAQTTPRDQFLDFLSEQEEDEETAGRPDVHGAHAGPYSDMDLWASDIPGGPEVTPEPIKPKWWGA